MPDSKDRFRALATSNSPSKSEPDAQSSEAPTDVEHSKVGPEKHNGNHSIREESDYDPLEDRRLLRRSKRQLWVWRCVSYLLLAALIGEGLLPVMQHISVEIALSFGENSLASAVLQGESCCESLLGFQDALALLTNPK